MFINLISIFFIAKSATVILMVLVSIIIISIIFTKLKTLYYILIFSILISLFTYINLKPNFLFEKGLETYRPVILIKSVSKLGLEFYLIAYNDESINGRVAQAVIPYIGIVQNYGVPGGYYTFKNITTKVIGPEKFFWSKFGYTHKIQSFIGAFTYELGFMGVIILITSAFILKRENNWKWREILIVFIALIPSIPLGMGLVPLLFGSKIEPKLLNNLKE